MRAAFATLAIIAGAACDVAGPLVDRLPKPPAVPEGGAVTACNMPPSCEDELVIDNEFIEFRSLRASIIEHDEDAGIDDLLDPSAIEWTADSIVLASAEPVEVTINEAPREGTLIELRGPVTLRFANMERLARVRVASASASSRIVLDHVTALDLSVGDAEQRFAGRLEAKHTAFERASVNAERVQLDSAVFVESIISAQSLVSRDGLMVTVVLELGEALFAPSVLREIEIRRCDALSFFGSNLWNVRIPRCRGDAATRFYDSVVVHGVIDGVVSADASRLEALRLGQQEQTSLLMWNSHGMRLAFCDFADDALLKRDGTLCSDCTDGALEGRVCTLPQDGVDRPATSTGRYNFCDRLNETAGCEAPIPDRPRPHTSER